MSNQRTDTIHEKIYEDEGRLKLMIQTSDNEGTSRFAHSLATRAGRFHKHDVCITAYSYLSKYYSIHHPDRYKLRLVTDNLEFHRKVQMEDERIRLKVFQVVHENANSRVFEEGVIKDIEDFLSTVDLKVEYGPYIYNKYYYLRIIYHSMKREYDTVIELSNEAYDFFNSQFIQMKVTKLRYLVRAAEAYHIKGDYATALKYFDKGAKLNIDSGAGYRSYLLHRSRTELSLGYDVQELLSDWDESLASATQTQLRNLILIYNELLHGRPVHDFSMINKYRRDRGGLSVSLNVAYYWSLRLQDDHRDRKNDVYQYCYRNLKDDPRSAAMLDYIVERRDISVEDLAVGEYNGDIEIIPFEMIHLQISRL